MGIMGMGDGCTQDDVRHGLVVLAEELDVGYLLGESEQAVKARDRKVKVWWRRLQHYPADRVRRGFAYLADSWEKDRPPNARQVELAVQRAPKQALTGLAKLHQQWYEHGMAAGEPCPVCDRPMSHSPAGYFADCDPERHYEEHVPLLGCHHHLHLLALEARAARRPWPPHPSRQAPAPSGPLMLPPLSGATA